MKTITKIIEKEGGLDALRSQAIRLENEPYMRLCIEWIGQTPEGAPLISVAHYGEQNGDDMRDPDMVFAVSHDLKFWRPVSFQNDYMGLYQEAMLWEDGKAMIRPKLSRDLASFSRMWDRNIKNQGFTKRANTARREA